MTTGWSSLLHAHPCYIGIRDEQKIHQQGRLPSEGREDINVGPLPTRRAKKDDTAVDKFAGKFVFRGLL